MIRQKVIVGLSGGVDSAVALALLVIDKRYDVEAIFVKNWDDLLLLPNSQYQKNKVTSQERCSWAQDYSIAQKIARQLNVKLHFVSFEKVFYKQIFLPLLTSYQNGLTPNPDVWCNRLIKFGLVIDYLKQKLDCLLFATGHYCRIRKIGKYSYLRYAVDATKDQTYFLAGTPSIQLQKVLFPLGNLHKHDVRTIAKKYQLCNYNRRDSTGICFIGERNFHKFLQDYIPYNPGPIVCADSCKVIGTHVGLPFYTIGQRKKINISYNQPLFVCRKDSKSNTLYVVAGHNHPFLWHHQIRFHKLMIHYHPPFMMSEFCCFVKIRHQPKQYLATCFPLLAIVKLKDEMAYGVAQGQLLVLYQDEICIASAEII